MNPYFEPPEGLNIEDYIPFLRYILAGVAVVGGILTVASIIYLAVSLIKAILGTAPAKGKYINTSVWGMIIGLLLLGGGWLGLITFFRVSMFPTKFL